MADLHSTLDFTPAGTERQLIVGYRPHHGETVMDGCIVLMTNSDKEQALAEELKQAKRALKEIKGALAAA